MTKGEPGRRPKGSGAATPLSRPVAVSGVPDEGRTIALSADEKERRALAAVLGVEEVTSLEGEAAVRPWRKTGIEVSGNATVSLVQQCVVTLEPIQTSLSLDLHRRYLPETELGEPDADIEADDEDPPEALPEDEIDIGAIVVEEAALNLDPYPRAPGARFESEGPDEGETRQNPFAVLQALKKDADSTA